ncbi:MAG: MFS transporter [Blastocatellia bacterium]|nr:MFS transporter [Blastocatellia bacterium]
MNATDTTGPGAEKGVSNVRWWIAALVFLSTVINYVDRQTLAVLMPRLSKELHLTNTEYGWISNAFLIPYTVMFIVAGLLIDRYGTKMVYGVAAAWWSIASMLHAVAGSAFGFGAFRFLLGTAESANFVGAQKVAAEWFPPKDRGTLNGLVQAGTVTGAIITPPIVIWMADRWGWRAAFLFTGGIGLLWVIAWFRFYHLPENHPRVSPGELQLIQSEAGAAKPAGRTPEIRWLDFFRFPQTWGLLLARIISDPVWWFYLFWLPKYLTEQQGLSEKGMSYVVWIPYLISDVGSIAGGWYSGRLIARKLGAVDARRAVMVVAAAMMPVGLLLLLRPSTLISLALISFVLGAHSAWKTNLVTLTVDIFPRNVVASVHGIVATGGGIGGAIFTTFAGYVIDKSGYTPLLVLMGLLHPLAYLCVRWLVKEEARIPER